MKKTILLMMIFILSLPLALAIYDGETWKYEFEECNELRVNVTGTKPIIEGEYTILNDCIENQSNYWICDCENNYYFNVSFNIMVDNNYTFKFNYDYSRFEQEQNNGGSGGSSSGSTCSPKWNCSDWSDCFPIGKSERVCTNTNNCNLNKPNEERDCYYPKDNETLHTAIEQPTEQPIEELEVTATTQPTTIEKKGMATGWKIAIVLFIIIAMIAIFFAIKNKQDD